MRLLSSMSGITKTVVSILVVGVLVIIAISYYTSTQLYSQNVSPSASPSFKPTDTPTPTSRVSETPTPTSKPIATPTPTEPANPTQTQIPELPTQERIRNSVMSFVKSNHSETAQFIEDLVWTGGRVTPPNLVGAETYMYYSQGWNVTINYPVIPNTIYNISADYSAPSFGIPYRIIWKGTWQNEAINETSYIFAQ